MRLSVGTKCLHGNLLRSNFIEVTIIHSEDLSRMAVLLAYYIMPIPPGIAGAAGVSSLISTIPASVVRSIADADAAF